jgi:hypothetical protein
MYVRPSPFAAVALAALACWPTLGAGPVHAQATPIAFLSADPKEPTDRDPGGAIANVLLRPNVAEPLYLYVRNPTQRDQDLTVVLAAGGDAGEEIARADLPPLRPGRTVRILPTKPPAAAAPPPGTKPVPPPGTALPEGLVLRLLDRARPNEEVFRAPLRVVVQTPSQYTGASATFKGGSESLDSRLFVTVRDLGKFTGPPAKLRLDLALVPDQLPGSGRGGSYQDVLRPGGTATLVAANLSFRGANRRGVVAVSVDDYARAFLFDVDFGGGTVPQPPSRTMLRMVCDDYAIPGKPFPVRLEVDNSPRQDALVEFGIDRGNTGEYSTSEHIGVRSQKVEARWDGAAGGLVLVTEVRDWVEDLDTAGMFGTRKLRLRLLDPATRKELTLQETREIVLDDTPPEEVRIEQVGKAVRGRMLDLAATGTDPESKVARVLFFLGEPPTPDGKPVAGGRVAAGQPSANAAGAYDAQLPLPDRAGKLQIGVRYTNNVGLSKDFVEEIEVSDPPPKPTTGAVKVTVVQGSPPRPQPGAQIQLRNLKDAMAPPKSGKASDKGEYTFEDLPPGEYTVSSGIPRDFTKAQQSVTVVVGETADVTLTLKR